MYPWWKFLHIAGAFGFVLAHGASAAVAFKLRTERSRERVRALVELSSYTLSVFYGSFVLLLGAGIVAGFLGKWWGFGWIWTSLALLLAITVLMYLLATPYYDRVRIAVGVPTYQQKKKGIAPGPEAKDEELATLLSSPRPVVVALIGAVGLLIIVWLMVLKPF
jgi:NADH:ubiquinone oxidoreductase subunit 2 (subunit N)